MNNEIEETNRLENTRDIFQRRQRHPTPVLLPGKSHGRRSLVGCSPWGREESDATERFHFHLSLSFIGEGSGNPLQCSCLENPGDGGAWWAAVYGVTQSRTRLKWLSSSRDIFKKIRDTKGTFYAKMGTTKDRNGKDLTESEDIKKRWQKYTEELNKKGLNDSDSHHGVITHLE